MLLVEYFERRSIGEVFVAPVDLILTNQDVFVPDLLVVADPKYVSKRGVEHYWIVDPASKRAEVWSRM